MCCFILFLFQWFMHMWGFLFLLHMLMIFSQKQVKRAQICPSWNLKQGHQKMVHGTWRNNYC